MGFNMIYFWNRNKISGADCDGRELCFDIMEMAVVDVLLPFTHCIKIPLRILEGFRE